MHVLRVRGDGRGVESSGWCAFARASLDWKCLIPKTQDRMQFITKLWVIGVKGYTMVCEIRRLKPVFISLVTIWKHWSQNTSLDECYAGRRHKKLICQGNLLVQNRLQSKIPIGLQIIASPWNLWKHEVIKQGENQVQSWAIWSHKRLIVAYIAALGPGIVSEKFTYRRKTIWEEYPTVMFKYTKGNSTLDYVPRIRKNSTTAGSFSESLMWKLLGASLTSTWIGLPCAPRAIITGCESCKTFSPSFTPKYLRTILSFAKLIFSAASLFDGQFVSRRKRRTARAFFWEICEKEK